MYYTYTVHVHVHTHVHTIISVLPHAHVHTYTVRTRLTLSYMCMQLVLGYLYVGWGVADNGITLVNFLYIYGDITLQYHHIQWHLRE